MLWTLLKKQILETANVLLLGRGEKAKKRKPWLMAIATALLFLYLCVGTFFMTKDMAKAFVAANVGWLFFALVGALATTVGVIGSAFASYNAMYDAKDNDLLLAMPIPPRTILTVRMLGVYATALLFTMFVLPSATAAYFYVTDFEPTVLFTFLPIMLFTALLCTAISCLLGFLVALVLFKVKRKNMVTMVFSLAFLVLYFWGYSKVPGYLASLINNVSGAASATKHYLYPFYALGKAAVGSLGHMAVFALICVAAAAIVWGALALNFLSLSTRKTGGVKNKYVSKKAKAVSLDTALFKKELARFTSSATYMLNGALGSLITVGAIVYLCVVGGDSLKGVLALIPEMEVHAAFSLLVTAIIAFFTSTNIITACSVSLEGSSLYVVKTLPVSTWSVLMAKLKLQLVITLPAAFIAATALCITIGVHPLVYMFTVVNCGLFALLFAQFGLLINLKFPKLTWKNEAAAVKQSAASVITMFGSFGILLSLVIIFVLLLTEGVMAELLIGCLSALLMVLCALLHSLLKNRGVKMFEAL